MISHGKRRDGSDAYRAPKQTAEFPWPGGRRARRAYFDAVRVAAPYFGVGPVVRVAAPECNPSLALCRFRQVVAP
jgi:hypothetical protein